MKCKQCGTRFTCGCQKAKLEDGTIVCKNCKSLLKGNEPRKTHTKRGTPIGRKRVTPTRQNERVRYNERRRAKNIKKD